MDTSTSAAAATAVPGDPAAQLQAVTNEMFNPGPDQLTYVQMRDLVLSMRDLLRGNPAQGGLSYEQVVDHVRVNAPKITSMAQNMENIQATLDPILKQADLEIANLKTQSQQLYEAAKQESTNQQAKHGELIAQAKSKFDDMEKQAQELRDATNREYQTQNVKVDSLIQHAQDKFQEVETKQTVITDSAKIKFTELETFRAKFETQVADKVRDLDAKMLEVSRVYGLISGLGTEDVTAVRATLAEKLGGYGGRDRRTREISEYKAIAQLERFAGSERTGYKCWLGKFKNALDQARGREWRVALSGLELHRICEDFEELTSLDDQWDEWFQENYGNKRSDGKPAIDLDEFKADLIWVLTDKLDVNLSELIKKYDNNGLRAYKKLYIWCLDISAQAKQVNMKHIMNPDRAKSDEELADRIEKWDDDRRELIKIDPQCELKDPFLLTAFKDLLTPKMADYIDNQMDSSVSEDYDEVRKRVYSWALKKRLQHRSNPKKSGGLDHMDIPDELPPTQCELHGGKGPGPETATWGGGFGNWWDYPDPNSVDVLGKGKAGAKGGKGTFNGTCNNCGIWGHRAATCRKPKGGGKGGKAGGGKGGGKFGKAGGGKGGWKGGKPGGGKGKGLNEVGAGGTGVDLIQGEYPGYCYNCGEWGHTSKYCPKQTGVPPPKGPIAAVDEGSTGAKSGNGLGALDLGTLDLGGRTEDPGPEVRDLKTMCEDAGWTVKEGKSRRAPRSWIPRELLALNGSKAGEVVIPQGQGWEEIKVTVDSGACDHVIPKQTVRPEDIKITDAVRKGVTYFTANGQPLPNEGEVNVSGRTREGHALGLTMQVAGVKKPLASVRKMCQAGNRVVFEEAGGEVGGYVENKATGARIPINKSDGTYSVSVFRPVDRWGGSRPDVASAGWFDAISDDEEDPQVPSTSSASGANPFTGPA